MRKPHGSLPVFRLVMVCAPHNVQCVNDERSREMKNSLLTRMFAPAPTRRQREEAYLNECVSRYDLERRMREVDAGKFR
jgi:Protein of unknown function (DUF3563)